MSRHYAASPAPAVDGDAELLRSAVEEAADVARRRATGSFRVWQKTDGAGPVTEIDIAVDRLLRQRLTSARPDYGWLSEESEDDPSRLGRRRVWVVDPIDGTSFLASGRKEFSISACLVEDGEPVLGIVCQPLLRTTYEAARGRGARCGDRILRGPDPAGASRPRLAGRKSALQRQYWQDQVPGVRMAPALPMSVRACSVAAGEADLAISHWPPWEWDIAAGDLIAREAGLAVSDTRGRPLVYNTPGRRLAGLLLGPGELHRRVLSQVVPAPEVGEQ